jgi:hypothetical protein
MQTFRAYLQDASGALTWAAWIDAADAEDAQGQANALRPDQTPTLELWSAADRRPEASAVLEPV